VASKLFPFVSRTRTDVVIAVITPYQAIVVVKQGSTTVNVNVFIAVILVCGAGRKPVS
jgi:hypothetical protein